MKGSKVKVKWMPVLSIAVAIALLSGAVVGWFARGSPGAGQGGTTISSTDLDAMRIAGVRVATEWDTAVHAGTYADPWSQLALSNAITDIGSANGTILFPAGFYAITASVVTPSNVGLWFLPGADMKVATGQVLNITGPLVAPNTRIFTLIGTGATVLYRPAVQVIPQWWGAKGDGSQDDAPAINAAIASLPSFWRKASGETFYGSVFFPPGTYGLKSTITANKQGASYFGSGLNTRIAPLTDSDTITLMTVSAKDTMISGFFFDGQSVNSVAGAKKATGGLSVTAVHVNIHDNWLEFINGDAIHGTSSGWAMSVINNIITDVNIGVYIDSGRGDRVNFNKIITCTYGIVINTYVPAGPSQSEIIGNIVQACTNRGIHVANDYTTVSGNTIQTITQDGIWLYGKDNVISGNVLRDIGTGANNTYSAIKLVGDTTYHVIRNVITGNTITSAQANKPKYDIGEDASYGDYNLVADNICANWATAAIDLHGVNSVQADNIVA